MATSVLDKNTIAKLYNEDKLSIANIAKTLDSTYSQVRKILIELGVVRNVPRKYHRVTKEDTSKIIEMYNNNVAHSDIATKLNLDTSTVSYHLRKMGLLGKGLFSDEKTQIPNTFSFKELTPEKAFLLGVIYGDGHVGKQRITIYSSTFDIDVLENINAIFGGKLTISRDKRSKNATYMQLTKKQLCDELRDIYGLVSNKSDNIRLPKLSYDLIPSFLSGYWAADGSIILTKDKSNRNSFYASISSCSEGMINDIYIVISNTLGINGSIIRREPKSNERISSTKPLYVLRFADTNALKFCNYMFCATTDATRCKRKYQNYITYKNWSNETITKVQQMHSEGYSVKQIKKETRRGEKIINEILSSRHL